MCPSLEKTVSSALSIPQLPVVIFIGLGSRGPFLLSLHAHLCCPCLPHVQAIRLVRPGVVSGITGRHTHSRFPDLMVLTIFLPFLLSITLTLGGRVLTDVLLGNHNSILISCGFL